MNLQLLYSTLRLKVGHGASLKHLKSTWRQVNLSSCERYKIVTSKALGTMHTQHSLFAGTFGKDRSTAIVVLISGALVQAD